MRKKLLMADDDRTFRNLITRIFAGTEWDVVAVSDGKAAMEQLNGSRPDLILLDINMPNLDGREVLEKVRRDPSLSMTPVIILSGIDSSAEKVAELNLGADDYITKPFDVMELVSRIENALKRNTRTLNANPLTLLPGAPSIEEEANARIRRCVPLAFLYLDIDNFKAYNDCYGYLNGDNAIKQLAKILSRLQEDFREEEVFIGHIGGDDFAIITRPENAETLAAEIARRFDELAPELYTIQDRTRREIVSRDRAGNERTYPLMTLTIAIATNENRKLNHYAKIVDIASEIKKHLKSLKDRKGSMYLKDRRTDAGPGAG